VIIMAIEGSLRLNQHSDSTSNRKIYTDARARAQAKSLGRDVSKLMVKIPGNQTTEAEGLSVIENTFCNREEGGFRCSVRFGKSIETLIALEDCQVFL